MVMKNISKKSKVFLKCSIFRKLIARYGILKL